MFDALFLKILCIIIKLFGVMQGVGGEGAEVVDEVGAIGQTIRLSQLNDPWTIIWFGLQKLRNACSVNFILN